MVKIKTPILSFLASGKLGAITLKRSRHSSIAEKTPEIPDAKTLAQLSWRTMYQKAVTLWHALSPAEKAEWESQARPKHMTGFSWFMSQALKPNPGLYLPLTGGTMAGDIEMNSFHIHGLDTPAHAQDPLRVFEYNSAIAPFLLREGARVYRSTTALIPTSTWTVLAFNLERYDTDTIHDNVTNNSRLTAKTAGVYAISFAYEWALHNTGYRMFSIRLNGATNIAIVNISSVQNANTRGEGTTLYHLAVNDYVEIRVWQNRGGDLSLLNNANYGIEFMMQRIGT